MSPQTYLSAYLAGSNP